MSEREGRSSLCWWSEGLEDAERCKRMVKAAQLIADLPFETYRRDRDLYNIRLYEDDPQVALYQFAGKFYSAATVAGVAPPESSTNNKAKAAIDTCASQVASTDQRARFRTVDGNYKQRRRTRKLQNFTDGLVRELDLHAKKQQAWTDGSVLESGVGALQFYRDGDRCGCQRVLATELAVDPLDGLVDGQWQTIYRQRPVPRDKVKEDFGGDDETDAIIDLPAPVQSGGAPADHIEVFEAWHLPSAKGAKDGYHVIALDCVDGVLMVEKFTRQRHDIKFLAPERRMTTGWGKSLMSQVRKLQIRINANSYRIDRAQKLFHAGHIYVDRTAKMKKLAMTNEIGSIWEGNGPNPPQQITFQSASPELYQQIERDGARIFENLGISVAASQGETNRGLTASAAAMREETAKSDKRNSVRQQQWERFHLTCIEGALDIVRDIAERNADGTKRGTPSGYKVLASDKKRGLTSVDWADIAVDEADYVLEVDAASPIPNEPDGLVALGERMIELGAWTPDQLAGYMQDLDADGRVNRQLAQQRQLEETFESLLYDDISAALPDEFTNLQLAITLGTEYLAQGAEDGVPDKHLDRVRRYLRRCKQIATPPAAAAPPAPAQAPAGMVA